MEEQLIKLCTQETPNITTIQSLINENVDIDITDSKLLVILCQNQKAYENKNFIKLVKSLIFRGVDVNSTVDGRNVLHILC